MTIDTTATPLDAKPSADQHLAPGHGIVHILLARLPPPSSLHMRLHRQRLWRCIAVFDALTHARSCGCAPAIPLVTAQPGTTAAPGPLQWPTRTARRP